jgi:hypothetical protein
MTEDQKPSAPPAQAQEAEAQDKGSKFFDPDFWDESSPEALARQDKAAANVDKFRWLIVRHSKFPLKGGDPLNGPKGS